MAGALCGLIVLVNFPCLKNNLIYNDLCILRAALWGARRMHNYLWTSDLTFVGCLFCLDRTDRMTVYAVVVHIATTAGDSIGTSAAVFVFVQRAGP